MSAYVVSDKHINALLTFANAQQIKVWIGPTLGDTADASVLEDLSKLGGILKNTNIEAVNERYDEFEVNLTPFEFKFERLPEKDLLLQIIKACNCYDYQACELNNYNLSTAWRIVDHIRGRAIGMLPGYDALQREIR